MVSSSCRGCRGRRALALGLGLWLAIPGDGRASTEPSSESTDATAASAESPAKSKGPPPDDPATQRFAAARAKAAIEQARKAAAAGDFEAAIRFFNEAIHHQPTGKLYFNLGACHHRVMMTQSPGSAEYETHREKAVDAYNHYLEADPKASDAEQVAEMIQALGGTPYSAEAPEPWTIELVEPDDVPAPPKLVGPLKNVSEPQPPPPVDDGPTDPPPGPTTPKEWMPRWGLSFGLPLVFSGPATLAASDELSAAPTLGLSLGGNGFLGARRRLSVGGEFAWLTQTITANERHKVRLFYATAIIEYQHRSPNKRIELGAGGSVGVAGQTLVFNGERLRCSIDERDASSRAGLWANARFYLGVLVGERRRHALTFRAGPGLGIFGAGTIAPMGTDGMSCAGELPAFEQFGDGPGPSLTLNLDIGYSPRF